MLTTIIFVILGILGFLFFIFLLLLPFFLLWYWLKKRRIRKKIPQKIKREVEKEREKKENEKEKARQLYARGYGGRRTGERRIEEELRNLEPADSSLLSGFDTTEGQRDFQTSTAPETDRTHRSRKRNWAEFN